MILIGKNYIKCNVQCAFFYKNNFYKFLELTKTIQQGGHTNQQDFFQNSPIIHYILRSVYILGNLGEQTEEKDVLHVEDGAFSKKK